MVFECLTELLIFLEEVLLGIFELFLILRLYHRICKHCSVSAKNLCLSAAVVIVSVAAVMKLLMPQRSVAMPPVTVLCSFFFMRCYPSDRKKKVLTGSILLVISCLWMVIADIVITPLQSRYYWGIIIFARLIFWLILEFINKTGKYEETDIPFSLWLLLMGITVLSAVALCTMWYFMVNRDDPYAVTSEIPVMLVLLFINISLFVFFDRFSILVRNTKEKFFLSQQLQMQEKHYHELHLAHQQIRAVWHDMRNYLKTASQLAREQDANPQLSAFLQNTGEQIGQAEQVISTGNSCLDSVLNVKLHELKTENICMDTKIQAPPGLKLSFEQAVIILGNLLDNAKEACLVLPERERWISLRINYTCHTLLIRIENSSGTIPLWENGLPLSTKSESSQHGLGLKNVRRAVEETGSFFIEASPSSFLVKIVLYDL